MAKTKKEIIEAPSREPDYTIKTPYTEMKFWFEEMLYQYNTMRPERIEVDRGRLYFYSSDYLGRDKTEFHVDVQNGYAKWINNLIDQELLGEHVTETK